MKCCVPNCKNNYRNTRLHVLPKDKETRKKWCIVICREDLIDVDPRKRQQHRVCEIHFAEQSKFAGVHNKTTLKYNACPTLLLPGLLKQEYVNNSCLDSEINMPMTENNAMNPLPRTLSTFVDYLRN